MTFSGQWRTLPSRDIALVALRRYKRGWAGARSYPGRTGELSRLIKKFKEWPDEDTWPNMDGEETSILWDALDHHLAEEYSDFGSPDLTPRESPYYEPPPSVPRWAATRGGTRSEEE